jgi:hypothetical protein
LEFGAWFLVVLLNFELCPWSFETARCCLTDRFNSESGVAMAGGGEYGETNLLNQLSESDTWKTF